MKAYQHLRAPNSPSGNPQRLYALYEGQQYARLVALWDEGYSDRPPELRNVCELPSVDISRGDYHRRLKQRSGGWPTAHHLLARTETPWP